MPPWMQNRGLESAWLQRAGIEADLQLHVPADHDATFLSSDAVNIWTVDLVLVWAVCFACEYSCICMCVCVCNVHVRRICRQVYVPYKLTKIQPPCTIVILFVGLR